MKDAIVVFGVALFIGLCLTALVAVGLHLALEAVTDLVR